MLLYAVIILIIAIIGATFFLISKNIKRQRLKQALNLRLLLIRLPQKLKTEEQSKDFKDEINFSSQLFGILAGLKTPFVLEAAVHHIGEEIHFYAAVPKKSIESVSRQIEGIWKEAQVEPVDDYTIFTSGSVVSAAYLMQKISYILPIRTYHEANIDTFSSILSGLTKINEVGEGAGLQILAKPAPDSAKKSIFQIINNLKKGNNLEDLLKGVKIEFKDIQKALNPKSDDETKKEEKVIDEDAVKTLEAKISKPLLSVNARIITSAPSQYQADTILESICGAFSQFSAPRRQEFKIIKPRNPQKLVYQYSFREFDDSQSIILNTEELASIFHLPTSTSDVPKIKWLKSKESTPPANLPKSGTLIGESLFRGQHEPIYITADDRRRHVYIVGQTGTGKTTTIINMAIDDINQGKGVGVIDPHGDLIEKILSHIPQNRLDDVIIFDPGDIWRPLGMNMLEYDFNRPEQKTFIVNEILSIFQKLYPESGEALGPVFQQYMRNAVLLLMEDAVNEPATLVEIPRIFTDAEFRNRKLSRIKNPVVIDFWEKEASQVKGEASLANMGPYITSKFNPFLANDYVRPIIGQIKSAFNFRQVMDEGKILLVNLSKGKIGDINANLLGMIITGKILMAALSRVDIVDEHKRLVFNLFIDEFQNYTTDSIATILSEARKYALNLTVAHQFIAQLIEKIRDAVFGNVGNLICLRVGATDAEFLVKQFEPTFNENDLVNIDNLNAYAKILINGQTSKPFNIKIPFPQKGNEELAQKLKELSRLKYGKDRQEIEDDILKRLRL
ncbi:MAG: type IV secretory system conjugative DNA transfer family protein [Patescibacteria group bacterium]